MNEPVQELDLKIAGQQLSLKSVALNTILTILILIGVCGTAFAGWAVFQSIEAHRTEAKEAGQAFVGAMKELTQAQREGTSVNREQTCLLRFDQKDRQANAEFCRQITR